MKNIVDYPNYLIDEKGIIYSKKSNKYMKPYLSCKKYLRISLWTNGKRNQLYVHRLVAETFIPNPENKPEVNHIDGDKVNNNVSNLEWVTPKENMKHAYTLKHLNMGNRKINKTTVKKIRQKYIPRKHTILMLSKEYGISESQIQRIVNNENWIL